jgi:hypothetical protein
MYGYVCVESCNYITESDTGCESRKAVSSDVHGLASAFKLWVRPSWAKVTA